MSSTGPLFSKNGLAEQGVEERRSGRTSLRDTDAGRPELTARSLHAPCSANPLGGSR